MTEMQVTIIDLGTINDLAAERGSRELVKRLQEVIR